MSAHNSQCHVCGKQADLQTVRARNGFPTACCSDCAPVVAAPAPAPSGRHAVRHLGWSNTDGGDILTDLARMTRIAGFVWAVKPDDCIDIEPPELSRLTVVDDKGHVVWGRHLTSDELTAALDLEQADV